MRLNRWLIIFMLYALFMLSGCSALKGSYDDISIRFGRIVQIITE